jgi:alpha-ketoglutarate-dependent taurine dioxygenase
MKYTLHDNGWTVFVDPDYDLKTATQEDINLIAQLIAKYTIVVFKKQILTVEDQVRLLKMFKNPEPLYKKTDPNFVYCAADLEQDPDGIVCRVTGELRDGKPGLAGWKEEMVWHCNHTYKPDRRPIVWLYGAKGTQGSRTSWNNTILAYADLDTAFKEKIKNIKSIYAGGLRLEKNDDKPNDNKILSGEWTPSLVHTNIANNVGLYFSPFQLHGFVGLTKEESDEIIDTLFKFVIQEKYLYHHDWTDGDLVLSEQWLGIHKRWPFEKMTERLLHRAAVDFPDGDYIYEI